MKKTTLFTFILSLTALLVLGGMASGQCVDDGNNDSTNADPISFVDSETDWVCAADPFDYYVLEIPNGTDVEGEITFSSPQEATCLRIESSDGLTLVNDIYTTSEIDEYTIEVPSGYVPAGTYYARVFYWSYADYDHEYTFTTDIQTTGNNPIQIKPNMMFQTQVPWPMQSGNAMHRSSSTFAGPTDDGYLILSQNLDVVPHNAYVPGDKKYIGLVAGNDDWVYFLDAKTMNLVTYNIIEGFHMTEYIQLGSTKPICLDKQGTMYYVRQDNLVSLDDPTVRTNWGEALPNGVSKNVMCAGSRIYTSVEGYQDSVQVWLASGVQSYSVNVDATVLGVAEGGMGAYFYVQTEESLYRFNKQGEELWCVDLPEPGWFLAENMETFGPIIGADSRVWVNDDTKPYWWVFNADGTEYKSGYWWDGLLPTAAAINADGKLVLGFNNREVVVYDDWDDRRIIHQLPGNPVDVIIDGDGTTYMCYFNENESEYLFKLVKDDPYLTTVSDIRTGIPSDLVDEDYDVEMAIVGEGRIGFLHETGYLTVIQSSPLLMNINIGDAMRKMMDKPDIPPGLEGKDKPDKPGKPIKPPRKPRVGR
jgi:hypothetical protein